ncbi:MAG: ATP-binding cassette domain-containing protein, partial [Chloroflexi bacterium]|nr:ATP-binding cassette domain-containing protein [Chloroflexota bacterium]
MSLVFVEGFSFTYAGSHKPTLLGIDLKVEPGEVCALLGASGSGKSTFCFAIAGFIPHFFRGALDGRVQVAGMDVRHHLLGAVAAGAGLGYQRSLQPVTWAPPTVEEEVAVGLENLGVPRD